MKLYLYNYFNNIDSLNIWVKISNVWNESGEATENWCYVHDGTVEGTIQGRRSSEWGLDLCLINMRGQSVWCLKAETAVGGNNLERCKRKASPQLYFSMKAFFKFYSRENIEVFALLIMSDKSEEWFSSNSEFSLRHEHSLFTGQTTSQALNHLYSLIRAIELWACFYRGGQNFPEKQQPQMLRKNSLRASVPGWEDRPCTPQNLMGTGIIFLETSFKACRIKPWFPYYPMKRIQASTWCVNSANIKSCGSWKAYVVYNGK